MSDRWYLLCDCYVRISQGLIIGYLGAPPWLIGVINIALEVSVRYFVNIALEVSV